MVERENLLRKIDEWVREGLISPEQAEVIKQKESNGAPERTAAHQVKAEEIMVYLGSLVIFLALAFMVGINWQALGSAGRILSAVTPTVIMLVLGWWLQRSVSLRLRRGAQALWLGGCLMSGFAFGVILDEMGLISNENLLVLVSSLFAMSIAGFAFLILPSAPQIIAILISGTSALFAFLGWLDNIFPEVDYFYQQLVILAIGLPVGGLWLLLSAYLKKKGWVDIIWAPRLFGALTILGFTYIMAVEVGTGDVVWQQVLFELIAFLASVMFIAASVKWQSQIFLYCGAAFLLFIIIFVNFEHFADKIGMPIALLIIGIILIGLGLGTQRLRERIQATQK